MQRVPKPSPNRPPQHDPWIGRSQWDLWKRTAAQPVYAIPAFKILNSAGKITRQHYLEMFLDMEEKFPGHGWKEAMNSLEAFYFKRSLSLKEFPLITATTLPLPNPSIPANHR